MVEIWASFPALQVMMKNFAEVSIVPGVEISHDVLQNRTLDWLKEARACKTRILVVITSKVFVQPFQLEGPISGGFSVWK